MYNSKTDIKHIEKKILSLSEREWRWLCYCINKKQEIKVYSRIPLLTCKEGLINFFSGKSINSLNTYLNHKDFYLVSSDCFSWLEKNIEAQYFLLSLLRYPFTRKYDIPTYRVSIYGRRTPTDYGCFKASSAIEEIYNFFDLRGYEFNGFLTESKDNQFNIDLLKYFERCYNESKWRIELKKWINKEKCNKAFESWLYEKTQKEREINPQVNKFYKSEHTFEFCTALLCSYKVPHYNASNDYPQEEQNVAERDVFIKRIKSNWSSKKHLMKNGKKTPHHMPLTKDTIKKLETLAMIQNLKREAIVTSLINAAYETHCLDENGKEKY